MKKKRFFINLTWAVLAVLVMTFTACPNPAGGGGEGDKTGANRITITGLQAVYDNGTEVQAGLVDSKTDFDDSSISISGSGTVTNGSLTLTLSASGGSAWEGSGSYYLAFTSDQVIIFISKEKIAFNGSAVTRTYASFELVVYSMKLGDVSDVTFTANMTLNDFLQVATASMPGGPYNYENWKTAMKEMMEEEEGDYFNTKIALDYTLYKDQACTQPFTGSDRVNANTVIYCKAPLGGSGNDGPDDIEAAGYITGTISFTGYTGTRPEVRINAESDFQSGGGYGWVDDRGSSYTVNAGGSFSIPFVQDFLSALQSGQRTLRFSLYIGSGGNQYSKTLESTKTVTAGQLSGGNLNIGSIGPVSLASITLNGTIIVTVNSQPVPRVQIDAYTVTPQGFPTFIGSARVNNPSTNASWSLPMAPLASPAEVRLDVTGYDSNWNRIFRRENAQTVSGVHNTDKTGIAINLGNISTMTLSGTLDVTVDGQKPYGVEINAYTDQNNPSNSQIGYLYINGYNTKPNTWSMQAEAPTQGSTVYFRIGIYTSENSGWSGYQILTTTCTAPAPGGSVPGIALSFHGSGGGTLTITGLPAGTYAVYAVTGNPSTYMDFALMMSSSTGVGAISGTIFAWVTTPSNGSYTIILINSSTSTTAQKATDVNITNGSGTVAYSSFDLLPMGN
jgi:hypothetical protein